MRRWLAAVAVSSAFGGWVLAADEDGEPWRETQVPPPAFPSPENLIEFSAGPAATARFMIDGSSLSVGEDGVIRFVLVIRTAGGATNVSFDGIRCDTRERRAYAYGRDDRSWHAVAEARWVPVNAGGSNSPYAALYRYYFCADGSAVRDADEARRSLSRKNFSPGY